MHAKPFSSRHAAGPIWQEELLAKFKADSRYDGNIAQATCWADFPIMSDLPSKKGWDSSFPSTLGYFSSSTTGEPKYVEYTHEDWRQTVAHRVSCLAALGISAQDTVGVLVSFGPWFSGQNITDALLEIGARVIPCGIYLPHLPGIARLLKKYNSTAIIATPSVALALASVIPRMELKHLILVGEAASTTVRQRLQDHFSTSPRSVFACSEAILGYEDVIEQGLYHWDSNRLHLEVLDEKGRISETGRGELLVTRRYGTCTPLLRYRLGDYVELQPQGSFRFLGRMGHGFSLASGVTLARAVLEQYLGKLDYPVHLAEFHLLHGDDGRDQLKIRLGSSSRETLDTEQAAKTFLSLTPDIHDVAACGYLEVEVSSFDAEFSNKRRIRINETPWQY